MDYDSEEIPSKNEMRLITEKEDEDINQLWESIGYHKPLAGYWFGLSFKLINLVITIIFSGVLVAIFYPYPESMGYRDVTGGIFTLYFTIMDLGTNMVMDRFIAEKRIKDPRQMLQYIQYFIWYQMLTGLVQTTTVSIYALFFVPRTALSYGIWLMLITSTTQYPGFLGVFRGVLGSLQKYNKTEILNFISGEIFQRITELGMVYLGRLWGASDPRIG
ncbi:MAG: hypothetical protein ACTSRA_17580, partial [Promethearchaeota archaeon]